MSIKAVSFDCAGTLIDVHWDPAGLAIESAELLGLNIPNNSRAEYQQLLSSRISSYREMNLLRSTDASDQWWRQLTIDWCNSIGLTVEKGHEIYALAMSRMYISEFAQFNLFADVVTTLNIMKSRGLKMAVLSNWDVSLQRVLQAAGISDQFDVAIASLEEGVEKPEKRLFDILCERIALRPEEILHVGDDAVDDLGGARNAGLKAVLVDRSRNADVPPYIASLSSVTEAIAWNS